MEISDESNAQSVREPTGYEPNTLAQASVLGNTADSAHAPVLFRARAMYTQELAVPPEFLQQMSAWATHTQQAQQDSTMLIQELYRRTQVLGDAAQQVPMTLCNQLRQSLGDVLKKHELNLTEVKECLSTLEVRCQDINTRLCKLESKEPDQERFRKTFGTCCGYNTMKM